MSPQNASSPEVWMQPYPLQYCDWDTDVRVKSGAKTARSNPHPPFITGKQIRGVWPGVGRLKLHKIVVTFPAKVVGKFLYLRL